MGLNAWLLIGTVPGMAGLIPRAVALAARTRRRLAGRRSRAPRRTHRRQQLPDRGGVQPGARASCSTSAPSPGRDGGGAWAYSFTQEWPFRGMRHQLSYTVPVLHDEGAGTGVGDVALNYRYQLVGAGRRRSVYVAPRVDAAPAHRQRAQRPRGRGRAASRPTSRSASTRRPCLRSTPTPARRDTLGPRCARAPSPLPSTRMSARSVIWLLRPTFNLLLELLWHGTERWSHRVRGPGSHLACPQPRVSAGHSISDSGLQIVPGSPTPSAWPMAEGDDGLFLYLSFEHPFQR